MSESKKEKGDLVFIGQLGDIDPLMRALCGRREDRDVIYVAANRALAEEVERRGLSCRSLDSYLELGNDDEVKKIAIEWLDAWADKPMWNGRSYKEATALEGAGAWWFMLPVLFPDVLRCIQLAEGFGALIKVEHPDRMWLVDVEKRKSYPLRLRLDANLPGKLAIMLCRAEDVEICRVQAPPKKRFEWWVEYERARCSMALYYGFISGWVARGRTWLSRLNNKRDIAKGKGTILLVTSPVYWRQTIDITGAQQIDDAIAGTSLSALRARGYRLLGLDVELGTPNFKQFDILRQKRARGDIDWRAIEFYNRSSRKEKKARRIRLSELNCQLGRDGILRNGICYKDLDFAPLLADRFSFLFVRYLEHAMSYLDSIGCALASEEIGLIVIVYEEGPSGRAATIAGQRHGIPTLALQHGTLSSPYAPAYYLASVSVEGCSDPVRCPVPTATAVYGEHTRSMLVDKSSYPPENVVVVGMPAQDGVIRSLQSISSERARASLGMVDTASTVLVISQPFFNRENRDHFISIIAEACSRMPDVQWAIKLHPSEGVDAWQFLDATASNVKVYNGDLHSLLGACDIVVSWYSTVILEAVLLARPVICVEIPGCLMPEDYLRDGLVVAAANAIDLENHLKALLEDETLRLERLQLAVEGLGEHVYQPDGMASERVADLVETMIRERSKEGKYAL
jgi:hypothetical protein